jgi:hypothetical protein
MPNWDLKFKPEYDYARGWLANDAAYAEHWRPLVRKLYKLMDETGFDPARAPALKELREMAHQGEKTVLGHKKVGEDQGLLNALGLWHDKSAGKVNADNKMRVAALKMLRHVYLLNKSGNRQVWLHSLPTEFKNWASDEFNAKAGTDDQVKKLLRALDEPFGAEQKKHLAGAAQHAMRWCQKTLMVLGSAGKAGKGNEKSRALVKRWFADPATSEGDLDGYIGKLHTGFKAVVACINGGRIVLTDWAPLRAATSAADQGWLGSEAFTFSSHGEGMDTVYIENAFFTKNPGNVLEGMPQYTRILVHELTHLVAGTTDVNNGGARYAWLGIGPHAGYPGSDCIRNADNWAFFAADCGGALTDGQRKKALKIV